MTELPRLELTEDPNKKNDYIIYRYSAKTDTSKANTQKKGKTKSSTKRKTSTKKRSSTKKRKSRKGFFNIFS